MITRKKYYNHLTEDQQFQTFDLGLAAALVSVGYCLWTLDKTNPKKVGFIFKKTEDIDEIVEDYWNSRLKVTARTYFESQKMLKNRIYSDLYVQ